MGGANLHIAWSTLFARALASSGVRRLVVSPGSRSTPLVIGLAHDRAIELYSVIDERSAAFVALGIARRTGEPVGLLCTSGTAAAHYLPAVMEASLARVPLVVITADRPWDAYDCAAPQTVDQVKLYGGYVRHYAELGLPDPDAFGAVTRVAVQGVARALGPDPGPVHVNARFRKPLEPQPPAAPAPWQDALDRATRSIPALAAREAPTVSASVIRASGIATRERVMLACGPSIGSRTDEEKQRLIAACESLGVPVLAEATSGLRFAGANVLRSIEAIVSSAAWRTQGPTTVVEVGAPMVSAAYARWALGATAPIERFVFTRHGWNDASNNGTLAIEEDPFRWVEAWAELERSHGVPEVRAERTRFSARWAAADQRAADVVERSLDRSELSEGATLATVRRALPAGATLIVANSSAVRDIDVFALDVEPAVTVVHQRGASGIDGLVAGAVGARVVSRSPVVLILGDVAMWHDVGSLQLAQDVSEPLVIVVLQNRGGRIFDRLPLAHNQELRAEYERYFLTDRGRSFESVVRGFGLAYARVDARAPLESAMAEALSRRGATVIESDCAPGNAERFAAVVRASAAAIDGV
jgi:2-succinyl-5-enolpyruvyl-6-hydroxy-3-cyclohexene-1-carboxylate synthase